MTARAAASGAVVATLLALGGGASGQGNKYATPQAVFDAAQEAAQRKDWKGFYQCLTPESGDRLVGQWILQGLRGRAGPKTKETEERNRLIDKVFSRHGLTADVTREAQSKVFGAFFKKGPRGLDDVLKPLLARIKDRGAFLADFVSAMEMANPRKVEPNAGKSMLRGLKVEGDTATATAVTRRGGKDAEEPIAFRKVDGGWRIELPDLFAKGKGKKAKRPTSGPGLLAGLFPELVVRH
jgi:hypothetical protein